ncbi:uncharacterized protein LOC111195039 isoform X2 [Astyanax mexicanus]|uniref:uncharacterized protein LOC111195039 isoform X2 n=1 Tax=Astyanax mexicanus TaxID=7994 RepID=UPI0020CAC615|nr:uncharacterized protein LOC111195039 isoform X2 [Astyanax mexicanus]
MFRLITCCLLSVLCVFQSTSQTLVTPIIHTSTQTDPPSLLCRATQLSRGTLGPDFRSKGTQTESFITSTSIATSTLDAPWGPVHSTPIKSVVPRAAKRPWVDEEEEEDEESDHCTVPTEPQSSTYDPAQSISSVIEPSQITDTSSTGYKDFKYIVFEKNLMELFETCPVCSRLSDVKTYRRGTFVSIIQKCHHCQYSKKWKSQPLIGSSPVGNIQLSAAIYFTGSSYFQVKKVFQAMHLRNISYTAFRRHANSYLEPAVVYKWRQYQETELQFLSQRKVKIGGDMRADSPGHSAKYGTYSVMNLETNNIIDIQLIQSNEVGGSHNMEKEGLKRSLQHLESKGVAVDYIVTDRHPQIQKILRDRQITHYYDVWHLEKGLSKKLGKVAKEKDCEVVKKWQQGIKNHVYWCTTSSSSGPEKVAKWTSVVNHVQDKHTHDNPLYPQCQHPIRQSRDRKKWFQPALYKLEKILTNKRVLGDVERLSSRYQTSTLEAFHSVILRFTPKSVVFPFIGMLCRLYLAAMHFNENAGRTQARTTSGVLRYRLHFPKAKKGGHTVKSVKSPPTYCYVYNLIAAVFDDIVPNPQPYLEEFKKIPIPGDLSSEFYRPPLTEAVAAYRSRFSQEQP